MRLPPEREKFEGLTTSSFSAAMGLNKYTSRAKLFKRLVTGERFEGNAATEYGHEHEPSAAAWYQAHTGSILELTGSRQRFFQRGPFGSTPDGYEPESGKLVEFKCPYSQKVYSEDYWLPMYMPQIQGQMFVTNYCVGSDFVVWTPTDQAIWHVPYSREYVDFMLPLLAEFNGYVESMRKPPNLRRRPTPPHVKIERIV